MKRLIRASLALLLAALLLAGAVPAADAEDSCFYSQLSEWGRRLYDDMSTPEALAAFRSGESFDLIYDGSYSDPGASASAIMAEFPAAFAAIELDHQELFWLSGYRVGVTGNSGSLILTVTPGFAWNWSDGGRSTSEDEASVRAVLRRLAAEAAAQGGAYEQLLYIHDWLTANNVYNSAAAERGDDRDHLPWTALSALTDLSQPVCDGYAAAFKLLCDELGIPCLMVVGYATIRTRDRHAWNQVLLDGAWYGVDVTFDDPMAGSGDGARSGFESHDYFLVGEDTLVDGSRSFYDTHDPDGQRFAGVYFEYPRLAAEAYDPASAEPEPEPEPEPKPAIVRQEIPAEGTAVAGVQPVTVGDRQLELPAYALLDEQGNPTNYVRLRDLALLLDGTAAQFDVTWSRETGITIVPKHPYEHPNGSEGNIPFTGDQPYLAYLQDTFVGGTALPLTAFRITWEGADHTYYQLRDLGRALDFNVGWSRDRGIFIEPDRPYTEAD